MEEADHKTSPSVKGRSVSSSVLHIDSIKTQVPILQGNGEKRKTDFYQGFDGEHYFVAWTLGDPRLRSTWVFLASKVDEAQ